MTIYEVYQPHTSGPEGIHSAIMISRHRSPGAASRAIRRAGSRLRRQPGMAQSWYDWAIRARDQGGVRRLTETEAEAAMQEG